MRTSLNWLLLLLGSVIGSALPLSAQVPKGPEPTPANRPNPLPNMINPGAAWQWSTASGRPAGQPSRTFVLNYPSPGGHKTVTDAAGNTYVVGHFSGTATFGSFTLTSDTILSNNQYFATLDVFVGKISPTGQWLWVAKGGTVMDDFGSDITLDQHGNVYIAGQLGSHGLRAGITTARFGTQSFTFNTTGRVFVAKLSPGGQWLWAQGGFADNERSVRALTADRNGNLFFSGGVTNWVVPPDGWTYINKISAGTGALIWQRQSANAPMDIWGLAAARNGDLYFLGAWNGATNSAFAGAPLSSFIGTDLHGVFLGRLSAGGQLDQFTHIPTGGSGNTYLSNGDIVLDRNDTPYIAFSITGPLYLGNAWWGTGARSGMVVAHLSPTGQLLWYRPIESGNATQARGITFSGLAFDGNSKLYVAGYTGNDWAIIGNTLMPRGLGQDFIAQISTSGQWQWATAGGPVNGGANRGISVDAAGNLYQTGTAPDGYGTVVARLSPRLDGPTITRYSPVFGGAGMSVTLTGTNLTGATQVSFADVVTTQFTVNSAGTQLVATVPATTGVRTGPIGVITPHGLATTPGIYTFWPTPTLATGSATFVPNAGPPGTTISVRGTNFTGATSVRVGTMAVAFTVTSDTRITFTIPAGLVSGRVTVTGPGGAALSTTSLIVTVPGAPTIISATPNGGTVGTIATITGTNFIGTTQVKFNTQPTTAFTVVNNTTITVPIPFGATTGYVTVTNAVGSATSPLTLMVVTPVISSFTPTSGRAGTVVTLSGYNMVGVTALKVGTTNLPFTSVSATQLTTTIPAGATSGRFEVTAAYGIGRSTTSFTVLSPRAGALVSTLEMNPNPAHERVWVQGVPAGTVIEIIDGQGTVRRAVLVGAATAETSVSLSGLPPGLYLVRAGEVVRRLVVE